MTTRDGTTSTRITRARLLTMAAGGAALAALPATASAASGGGRAAYAEFPYFPQTAGRYTTESVREIVSNLLTLKMADITPGIVLLSTPSLLSALGISGLALTVVQAIVAQDQYHIDFLQAVAPDAAPTTTFTIDPNGIKSPADFANFGELLGNLLIGGELAGVREMAELGEPQLAKNLAQMVVGESEALGAFRMLLAATGDTSRIPPNNKAFGTDLFLYTRDAVGVLQAIGLIGGSGTPVPYPGRSAALAAAGPMASAVRQQLPNNAISTVTFTGPASLENERD